MTAEQGLSLLTGPGAEALLAAAVTGELVSWRIRQVDHRPGTSTTVSYDATVRGPAGTSREVLGASTGLAMDAPVTVWRFPLDPGLPALATAVDDDAVREVLRTLGIRAGAVRLDVRSYRPRRRAVVEVRAPGCRLFLKVLRPQVVQGLHERHVLLREAGLPVPRSLGWSTDGLLVLEALTGRTMRGALRAGAPVPGAEAVVQLLDRLPEAVCALPRRPSWTDEVAHYASVVAAVLPAEADRCAQLAERVRQQVDDVPAAEPAHGDLYDGQLLVDDQRVVGLLDVDTVGPGRRVDDLACLLGHLEVLALEGSDAGQIRRTARRWREELEQVVDRRELQARVAGVVVSLATGPHRVQQADWEAGTVRRLDLAERWLTDASVAS